MPPERRRGKASPSEVPAAAPEQPAAERDDKPPLHLLLFGVASVAVGIGGVLFTRSSYLAAQQAGAPAAASSAALDDDGARDDAFTVRGPAATLDILSNDVLPRAAAVGVGACLEPPRRADPAAAGAPAARPGRFTDITEFAGLGAIEQDTGRTAPACLFDDSDAFMQDADARALFASSKRGIHKEGYSVKLSDYDDTVKEALFGDATKREATASKVMMVDKGGFCFPERHTGGAAVGDVDGDGLPDLFFTRMDGPVTLLRNAGGGRFEDATAAAGLAALELEQEPELTASGKPKKRQPPRRNFVRTNGAVFGDIDNDGDLDLAVTTVAEARFLLLINDGSGRFTEEGGARGAAQPEDGRRRAGMSVTMGDFDNDGLVDLHTNEWLPHFLRSKQADGSFASHARLLRNGAAGKPGFFEDVTEAAGVGMEQPGEAGLLRELRYKVKVTEAGWSTLSKAEMAAKVEPGQTVRGEVVTVSNGVYSFASALSDLDGDGWLDLLVAADFGSSLLFWNNRDGTFTEATVDAGFGRDQNGMGLSIGDVNGDGAPDVFVSSIFDHSERCRGGACPFGWKGNVLYLNKGDGSRSFQEVGSKWGVDDSDWAWGSVLLDYDLDGDLDLACTAGYIMYETTWDDGFNFSPVRLWENRGEESAGEKRMRDVAEEVGLVKGAREGRGMLAFDADGDGDEDLLMLHHVDGPMLWRNDVALHGDGDGSAAGWVGVRALDGSGKRDLLGAKVVVESEGSDGAAQHREIGAQSHFLGASSAVAHFGLATGVESVSVRVQDTSPDGETRETVVQNVPANSTLVVRLGSGTASSGDGAELRSCGSAAASGLLISLDNGGATAGGGSVALAADGASVEYTAPEGRPGEDSFTYRVRDLKGGEHHATVLLRLK